MPGLVPRKASSAELPNQAPSRPKRDSGVGTGEKVLVSCFIMAMTARICFISSRVGLSSGRPGAASTHGKVGERWMRALSMLLLLAGAAITGGAVFWWADFYGGLMHGTKYTLWD